MDPSTHGKLPKEIPLLIETLEKINFLDLDEDHFKGGVGLILLDESDNVVELGDNIYLNQLTLRNRDEALGLIRTLAQISGQPFVTVPDKRTKRTQFIRRDALLCQFLGDVARMEEKIEAKGWTLIQ
jgi:hypothetical protein